MEKVKPLSAKGYRFLVGGMDFTSSDRSQNMLVYQATPDTLELKKDKGIDYVLSWESERVFTYKLTPLYTIYLNSTKRYGYRTASFTRKKLVLILVKRRQSFVWVCNIMAMITVIYLLIKNKSKNLQLILTMLLFQISLL